MARVSLLGSSCPLISGEQMEGSPHLAGDQFYPRSSSSIIGLFVCSLSSGGAMSPPKPVRRRRRRRSQESLENLRHTQDAFRDFLRDAERSGVQLVAEFSYLSLLCLHTRPLHLICSCLSTPHATSRNPPGLLPKLKPSLMRCDFVEA